METGCAESKFVVKTGTGVVLAAILDAKWSKSLENAIKWRRKAIITEVTGNGLK